MHCMDITFCMGRRRGMESVHVQLLWRGAPSEACKSTVMDPIVNWHSSPVFVPANGKVGRAVQAAVQVCPEHSCRHTPTVCTGSSWRKATVLLCLCVVRGMGGIVKSTCILCFLVFHCVCEYIFLVCSVMSVRVQLSQFTWAKNRQTHLHPAILLWSFQWHWVFDTQWTLPKLNKSMGLKLRVLNRHTRELISAQKMSHGQQQRPESPTVTLSCSQIRMCSYLFVCCTSGGVHVPHIYMHARWELPQATRVNVVVLARLLSAN